MLILGELLVKELGPTQLIERIFPEDSEGWILPSLPENHEGVTNVAFNCGAAQPTLIKTESV